MTYNLRSPIRGLDIFLVPEKDRVAPLVLAPFKLVEAVAGEAESDADAHEEADDNVGIG
jgi:hypothetical protein